MVAFDVERDIAVLWVNLDAFPEAFAAAMAKPSDRGSAVAEGDRVFTIGSPLNQRKMMTPGLVSKVEARAIAVGYSDQSRQFRRAAFYHGW